MITLRAMFLHMSNIAQCYNKRKNSRKMKTKKVLAGTYPDNSMFKAGKEKDLYKTYSL
jgi:hypothetical protein